MVSNERILLKFAYVTCPFYHDLRSRKYERDMLQFVCEFINNICGMYTVFYEDF